MNILNQQINQPKPDIQMVKNRLLRQTKNAYDQLLSAYNNGASMFWNNPNYSPAEICGAFGTDAVELFSLHSKIGALLEEITPGSTAEAHAMMLPFTINEDGSVTISEPEA
jgi:hypothetical protein